MKNYFELLKSSPLFEGIGEDAFLDVLSCIKAKDKKYRKNQTVFAEGEVTSCLGIVLEGSVKIVREDFCGKKAVLASLSPPSFFGETFACAGDIPLPASAVAASDSAVMLIDVGRIFSRCEKACAVHTKLMQNLLRVIATQNISLNKKLGFISKRTTGEKLMEYLLSEAKRRGSDSFRIPYDRRELAELLGVERSAMSTVLGRLRDEGKIEYRKNNFTIIKNSNKKTSGERKKSNEQCAG